MVTSYLVSVGGLHGNGGFHLPITLNRYSVLYGTVYFMGLTLTVKFWDSIVPPDTGTHNLYEY